MLLVPYLMGTLAAGWTAAALPLLVVWLLGYVASYSGLMALKVRRRDRFVRSLRWSGALAVPFAIWLVVVDPWVVAWVPLFAVFSLVNVWFVRHRDERSWLNGAVSAVQASLMALLAYAVGGGSDWLRAWLLFAASAAYFVGSVLYVKTMIRARGERGPYLASVAYHCVVAVALGFASLGMGVLFGWFAARAYLMPRLAQRRPVRPMQVGIVEIVNSVLLLVVTLIATAGTVAQP
jgi:hypothetical protein